MDQKVKVINPEAYLKALKDMDCGKTRFAEVSAKDMEMSFFTIPPPVGYVAPKHFPDCCPTHRSMVQAFEKWFDEFPNCCKWHKKLSEADWFSKEDYNRVVRKIMDQLSYSQYIVKKNIGKDDWYEDITDYIHYNISSFGQLPTDYGSPIGLSHYRDNLLLILESLTGDKHNLPQDKISRLIGFVKGYGLGTKTKVDFNQLETTYKNWLKVFPFGTSYFKDLKKYYESHWPILQGKPELNRYSRIASIKITSQPDFIDTLTNLTKQLLEQIDSTELVEKGIINDSGKHILELTSSLHRIKQVRLVKNFSKGEVEYVKVLREWLANEKEYFKEIEQIMQTTEKSVTLKYGAKLQLPPIANEDAFEDFICDLYNATFPGSHFQRHGKRGNNQKGIDVISILRKEGVQCKKKDVQRKGLVEELKKDFESDISKAIQLKAEMKLLIFASTFSDSTLLNEHLQTLMKKMTPGFDALYIGWDTLSSMAQGNKNIMDKYFAL